ncbi:hypothetical protein FRC20_003655 [Serendipita sp. 405]|nr:hypothetical protein FRC20_003655 [Serendipita sp. 405]
MICQAHIFNGHPLKDRTFKVTTLHERDLARDPEPLDAFLATYGQSASSFGIAGSYVPCNSDTLKNYTACLLTKIAVASPEEVLIISLHYQSDDNPADIVDHTVLYERLFPEETNRSTHQFVGCNVDRLALQLYGEYGFRLRNAIDVLSLGLDSIDAQRTIKRFAKKYKTTIDGGVLARVFEDENEALEPENEQEQNSYLASRAWFGAVLELASEALAISLSAATPVDVSKRTHEELMELKSTLLSSDRLRGTASDFQKHAVSITRGPDGHLYLTSAQFNTRIRTSDFDLEVVFEHETVTAKIGPVKGKKAKLLLSEPIDLKKAGEIQYARTMGKEEATTLDNQRSNFILFALQGRVSVQNNKLLQQIWFPESYMPSSIEPTLPELLGAEYQRLNRRQKRAVEEMMKEGPDPRIVLIHGPPGTGKTSVIAAMTQCLLNTAVDATEERQEELIQSAMRSDAEIIDEPTPGGPGVWIVAQSNVAVKNVAEKLIKVGILDFKLIVSGEFHFEWHEHIYTKVKNNLCVASSLPKEKQEVRTFLGNARVILCTLSMLTASRLRAVDFYDLMPVNTVVVDEASQIQIGDLLPMLHYFESDIKRICFVGDHKQLAPYGQEEVQEIESIFEKEHIVKGATLLNITYRLPQAICQSISSNVYQHELLSAHDDDRESCSKWIDVPGEEEEEGTSYINKPEAEAAILLAKQLEIRQKDYRLISPYATQTELLLKRLKEENMDWEDKCFNVDSFQGNEADYIVISLVRTKTMGFLDNNRRANVLLSRCKKGMFIISNKELMLRSSPTSSSGVLLQRYALEWTAQMQRVGRQWYTYQDLEVELDMIDPDLKPTAQSSQTPAVESKKTKRHNKRRK